jgi:hypothetical protein
MFGSSAIVHAELAWPRGPRRLSDQGPGKRSCMTPPPLLSSCGILLHDACYTAIIGMSMIFLAFFLICVGYTFAFLPLQKMRKYSVFTHAKMSEGYTENG